MIVGYYKNYLYTTDKVSSEKKKKIMRSPSIWFRTPKPVRIRQSGRTRIGGVTTITLSFADRSVKIPKGIVEDVLVKVDKFYYPMDFVVLNTESVATEANYVPLILGRPFLATSNTIINCRNRVMQLTFGNMTLKLNIFHLSSKH